MNIEVKVSEMVKNWQHLCQKLAVVVAADDFIGLTPNVVVELTGDKCQKS
jgi:hypothetical protein